VGDEARRWLAFDHPGSPEPVGHPDEALSEALLASRTREVPADEAERIAARLRARDV
jgi:hypothetical protein